MPNLNVNGRNMSIEAAPDTPLLWAIREQLQMTGTKFVRRRPVWRLHGSRQWRSRAILPDIA